MVGFHSGKYSFDINDCLNICAYVFSLRWGAADLFRLFLKQIVSFPALAFSWCMLCVAHVLIKYSSLGTGALNIEKETFQQLCS